MDIKSLIRDIQDFPKPGIVYRDITTLLQNSDGLNYVIDHFTEQYCEHKIDYVIGIESRGFIFGAPIAYKLGAGFVPVRKPGKLPGEIHSVEYELEYGSDRLEVHQDAIQSGSRILIVDDLIATGGTAAATAELINKLGSETIGFAFIIELLALEGRSKLPKAPVHSLVTYS
jgi:adenine phosphoribosyltransferase